VARLVPATPGDRIYVIAMVLLLAGLPLLARPFLGQVGGSRAAWFLRAGIWAALLALMPAEVAIDQFTQTPPRGGAYLRLYVLIAGTRAGHDPLGSEIFFLVLIRTSSWPPLADAVVQPAAMR
jgi:hypothetical protein